MSKTRIYTRNLAANWIGYAVNLVSSLVLSWFAYRYLGDVRYGLWSLLISLTGYFGMFDLGLRPALYRHFNWYLGRNQPEKVNEAVCTGLAFFAGSTGVLLVLGVVLSLFFHSLFPKTPVEHLTQAKIAVAIVTLNVGLSLVSAVFVSLIETLERYDLRAYLDTGSALIRVGGGIVVLVGGFGLVGLAVAVFAASAIYCLGGWLLARRVFPSIRLARRAASRPMLKELVRFGVPCFFTGLGSRIILYSDSLMIAWLLDLPMVGYYSLVVMLLEYGRAMVDNTSMIFTPEIQQSAARSDLDKLRYFLPRVTRVTMAFAVLILVGVMVLGQRFLTLFYGAEVGDASRSALLILGVPYLAISASRPAFRMLVGTGRVMYLAFLVMTEAVLNIVLTIVFVVVFKMGLAGVALGTALPMICLSGTTVVIAAARYLNVSAAGFFLHTAGRWVPAAAAFGAACLAVLHAYAWESLGTFVLAVLAAAGLYVPLGWYLILPQDVRNRFTLMLSRRVGAVPLTDGDK